MAERVGIAADVKSKTDQILNTDWETRKGRVVPTTETVFDHQAVILAATYLYADLADSSTLAHKSPREIAAKIFRSYLDAATRILKHCGGEIRSFDGDRVMAIFIGDGKNTSAVKAAFGVGWAVDQVLRPKIERLWSDKLGDVAQLGHGVGIATGEAWLVRGGVRGNNDLVSVGEAPNVAAKLSSLRTREIGVYATSAVQRAVNDSMKVKVDGATPVPWRAEKPVVVGGASYEVLSSGYWREPK